jgi:hypothetical protein
MLIEPRFQIPRIDHPFALDEQRTKQQRKPYEQADKYACCADASSRCKRPNPRAN